jgi:hypothetical protein
MLDESSGQLNVNVEADARLEASGLLGSSEKLLAPDHSSYTREFWLIFAATFALNSAANLFVMLPIFVVKLGGGASTIGEVVAIGSFAALIMRMGARFEILRFVDSAQNDLKSRLDDAPREPRRKV